MMDNYSSADDLQNVDDEAAHVVTDCVLNPLIVRNIMESLPSKELRQLSLVNKLWKREARSVIRKRNDLTVYVGFKDFEEYHPCEEVNAFISDLKQTDLFPLSGISICIYFDTGLSPFQIAAKDALEGVIFDQPSLKTVSVQLSGSWLKNASSSGVLLAKKVLQDSSGFLEELDLGIDGNQEYFMEKVVQDCTFPRLQILKLRKLNAQSDEARYENYMKTMVSRAPNLRVLHSNGCIDMLLRVVQGSSVLPVFAGHISAPGLEWISQYVGTAVRFDNMELRYTGPEFDLEMFNRIASMLLRAPCTTTLRSMRVDAVLAVSLMCFGIQLENVKTLQMDIDYRHLEEIAPRILDIVKNFDFTRLFPNLSEVYLDSSTTFPPHSQDHMNEVVQQANAILTMEPLADRAVRIKNLTLGHTNLSSVTTQFYVEMFPNIKGLTLQASVDEVGQIWSGSVWNWLDLRELEVHGDIREIGGNLDSIFCGIFPEEVAELRQQDEDYLKRVNIVPVMPALTCLRNLRTLSLDLHVNHYRNDPNVDATFIFSKVTTMLAFARMPTLAVSLKLPHDGLAPAPAMANLRPYMSFNKTHDPLEDEEWDD